MHDDDHIVKLTVRVLEDVHIAMKAAARARFRSLNDLINQLITDYLIAHDRRQVRSWHEEEGASHEERIDRIRRRYDR